MASRLKVQGWQCHLHTVSSAQDLSFCRDPQAWKGQGSGSGSLVCFLGCATEKCKKLDWMDPDPALVGLLHPVSEPQSDKGATPLRAAPPD